VLAAGFGLVWVVAEMVRGHGRGAWEVASAAYLLVLVIGGLGVLRLKAWGQSLLLVALPLFLAACCSWVFFMLKIGSIVGALISFLGCGVAYATWVGCFLWSVSASNSLPSQQDRGSILPRNAPSRPPLLQPVK
jgi:hypothetical protein